MYFLSNNVQEKILHGTTTVGIKAKDGIVLCADMRASAGYFIANNNTMKIQKIDRLIGFCSGFLVFGGLLMFFQDLLGKQGWIELLRENWINLGPAWGLIIVFSGIYMLIFVNNE